MSTTYTYSILNDFPDGVNERNLEEEINNELTLSVKLDVIEIDQSNVNITFISSLSAGEITILDNLIANHDPTSLELPPLYNIGESILQPGPTGPYGGTGTALMAVQKASLGPLSGVENGDMTFLQTDQLGRLKVIPVVLKDVAGRTEISQTLTTGDYKYVRDITNVSMGVFNTGNAT